MNKKAFKVVALRDKDNEERIFWGKKSYLERLEALENLRQITFGYDPSTTRLQRVLRITKLKKN